MLYKLLYACKSLRAIIPDDLSIRVSLIVLTVSISSSFFISGDSQNDLSRHCNKNFNVELKYSLNDSYVACKVYTHEVPTAVVAPFI